MELDVGIIQQLLQDSNISTSVELSSARRGLVTEFVAVNGKQPTVEVMRNIQSSAFAMRILTDL
jgi:ribosomal protein S12